MVWLDFIFTRGLIRGEQKSTMGDTALQVVVVGETIWAFPLTRRLMGIVLEGAGILCCVGTGLSERDSSRGVRVFYLAGKYQQNKTTRLLTEKLGHPRTCWHRGTVPNQPHSVPRRL